MSETTDRIKDFIQYGKLLKGDEKGEAQVFCDRLFQAFGHKGYKEAGATLETRIKSKDGKGTSFADLIWPGRVLIEMKKAKANLQLHYQQAFDYWINAVPNRPRYVVLCNFKEFWIYDFDKQIDQPIDRVLFDDLPKRYTALNFLFPHDPPPIFENDLVEVTREAADKVAQVFNSLITKGEDRSVAQRFVLQCVIAMFAEDIELLPQGLFYQMIQDCIAKKHSSYDLFGQLFNQMNNPNQAKGGRFKDVPYFNGGVFSIVEPIELSHEELTLLEAAGKEFWTKVNPAIFGTIFQQSMGKKARHAYGAHFTSEADIMRVINPTIVYPWRERIDKAKTLKDLIKVRNDLTKFRVLDPACGSGNFLYVSFRELVRLEIRLLSKIRSEYSLTEFKKNFKTSSLISPHQFYGIERDSFGIELAKVTLMLAKKLAIDEAVQAMEDQQIPLDLSVDEALPLDNLDKNFINDDALFAKWPEVDSIVGNPPYQSKNKIQDELGRAYVNRMRKAFPKIPGRADYCVYWFRKAHDELKENQRAGLVGTNTIRQNYSREGGLDYIVQNNGTITDAVSSQVWSGEAVVHVSIVNWIKGKQTGKKRLYRQLGDNLDSPWEMRELERIGSSLSYEIDVTMARPLKANASAGNCYQGQTHGHEGFLISSKEYETFVNKDTKNKAVLFPYLTFDEMLSTAERRPKRYVIDFSGKDIVESKTYNELFKRIEVNVLPARKKAAEEEIAENKEALKDDPKAKLAKDHQNTLEKWWQLFRSRQEAISYISKLPRYIVCGRITKRPIFEFISCDIHPNDALTVFPFADDYSFGILQSDMHWRWFVERCSTMKSDPRYTSNTVFDSFPWPQNPSSNDIKNIAEAAKSLRDYRNSILKKGETNLREMYRLLELPGKNPLKDINLQLDDAINKAYGIGKKENPLQFLFDLNAELANAEAAGKQIIGPGLHPNAKGNFVSSDCVSMTD